MADEGPIVLDACALIAFTTSEPGAEVVGAYIAEPGRCRMHAINVAEVLYDAMRRDTSATLARLTLDLGGLGVSVDWTLDDPLVGRAAEIKATWRRVSLADCFAVALAERLRGSLVTTAHHELDPLAEAGFAIRFAR